MLMNRKSLWENVSRGGRAAEERLPSPAHVLGSVWERKTYRHLVYILTAAPLGVGYTLLLVAGPFLRLLQIVLQAIVSSVIGVVTGIGRTVAQLLLRLAVLLLVIGVMIPILDAGLILLRRLVLPIALLLLVHSLWLRWRAARHGSTFGERAHRSRLAPLYASLARFFNWLFPATLRTSRLVRWITGIGWAVAQLLLRLAVLSLVIGVAIAILSEGLILLWWLVFPVALLLLVHSLWLRWRAARRGSTFGERAHRSRLTPFYASLARFFNWFFPSFSLTTSRARAIRFFRVRAPAAQQVSQGSTERQTVVVPAIWRRLVDYERRFTVRWLDVDIPPISQGETDGDPFMWSSLLYLLVKVPLGVVAWIFTVFAASIIGWLLFQPLVVLFSDPVNWLLSRPAIYLFSQSGQGLFAVVTVIVAVLSAGLGLILIPAGLYVLNVLAAAAGNVAHLMLTPSDTAQRLREAEVVAAQERAKAERAEQVRRELIVNVSHELRTPLASIRGHIESLLWALDEPDEGSAPPRTLRSYLSIVHRETESLRTLVDELLALAHAESNELHLALTAVDAGDVVEEVFQSLAPLAKRERRVTVARTVEPDLPPVLADRQRLTQVLLNLVRNAIAYTPEGGIVAITLERGDAGHLLLAVSDTGIGIQEEELGRVFDRFYRTDASKAQTPDGFGLGLPIARDLVTAMGGTISVESKVGEGSCFQLRLKVAGSSEGDGMGV